MEEFKGQISDFYFKECYEFIKRVREYKHKTVLERQLKKFEQLYHKTKGGCSNTESGHSNHQKHTCKVAPPNAIIPSTNITTPNATTATTTPSVAVTTTVTTLAAAATTTTTEQLEKWVRNLLGVSLTTAQMSLLAHGPNFAIAPRHPLGEYIAAVEQVSLNLEPHNAEELRAGIRRALRNSHKSRRNITKDGAQDLSELKKDHSRVILTADKGVALVVMNRTEYNNKAQKLLEDGGAYKEIKTDPTNKLQNKLINLLKKIKVEGGISDQLYKEMYPTAAVAPKFYGLPKTHRRDIPLRPIESSMDSINYEVAKELSRILRPLVGNSLHHIKNTGYFVQQMKGTTLQANECITSYDVSALFTSVCIDPAINIITKKLELDQEFQTRTSMKVEQVISLLEFCMKTTYF